MIYDGIYYPQGFGCKDCVDDGEIFTPCDKCNEEHMRRKAISDEFEMNDILARQHSEVTA